MTTIIKGRWQVQAGRKLQKIDTANVSQKLARKGKADRQEKQLRANRERTR